MHSKPIHLGTQAGGYMGKEYILYEGKLEGAMENAVDGGWEHVFAGS